MSQSFRLKRITYPTYSVPQHLGAPPKSEFSSRIEAIRKMMQQRGLSHVVVYGDREHFANLTYLTNFDPRFEEALLILRLDSSPLILVGNEGVGHLGVSPLFATGDLRYELFQSFSLPDQPRESSRSLRQILQDEGINEEATLGVIGWKSYAELPNAKQVSDVPAYIWETLKSLCSKVSNVTDLLISPLYGLRARLSAYEVALFERANIMASDAVKALLVNLQPGMTDFELMSKVPFTGYPFSCHPSVKSSGNVHYGLSSPTGDVIKLGQSCSMNVAYWGSNICRAGWVAKDENDLPTQAKDYVNAFAGPYFLAVRSYLASLQIGTSGAELYNLIHTSLPQKDFAVTLNPGHLIHFDEWLSSPVYEGSTIKVESGMCFQIDIIPRSKIYSSVRMEEGVVIADEAFRNAIKESYPDVYERCMQRREFMESLGFVLPKELLPLSNLAGIIPPYLLNPELVLSL